MDKSKMAKAGTKINYRLMDNDHGGPRLSDPIKDAHGDWCCCEECESSPKSIDKMLNDGEECCGGKCCE